MRFLRQFIAVIFPWPAKHERKQAIESARREKEISQANVAYARALENQFQRIVEENHFAESIARQIIRRERGNDA